jgi:hypothetical protein
LPDLFHGTGKSVCAVRVARHCIHPRFVVSNFLSDAAVPGADIFGLAAEIFYSLSSKPGNRLCANLGLIHRFLRDSDVLAVFSGAILRFR